MKAEITFEKRPYGQHPERLTVDYDSSGHATFWIQIRSPEGVGVHDPAHITSRVYRIRVGEKGGLTLS